MSFGGISGDVSSGFQSQSRLPYSHIFSIYKTKWAQVHKDLFLPFDL